MPFAGLLVSVFIFVFHLFCYLKSFFPVDRETVRLALKVMDPDGVAERKKHRLKRRKYFSPVTSTFYLLVNGPNSYTCCQR